MIQIENNQKKVSISVMPGASHFAEPPGFSFLRNEVITIAATRLIALHVNKGKTVAQCLADRTDYTENAAKTDDGKYISSYACDPKTCDEEFLLSKRQYEQITGRKQKHDVIAYQIRQSFRPGEVTPEEANEIGYELARRFTKGRHAFIVATHIDKAHIHNHIIFNSTSLDCTRKFRDFHLSGLALARLSDVICLGHKLSIIQRKPYSEREKRTEYPQKKSHRDELCENIDAALLNKPKDFDELIKLLAAEGYDFKNGKHPAVRKQGQKRFIRFRSLGESYSVEALTAVISGQQQHRPKHGNKQKTRVFNTSNELSFLIDIQKKMNEGMGIGYTRWAKNFNIKQRAQALIFMTEKKIKSAEELEERTKTITAECDALLASVKADEVRLQEIAVLKTHIINYAKSREVFAAYKASGYSRKYFEEHREMLSLRRAAKEAFDNYKAEHGKDAPIPKVKELSAEYAEILARKKENYSEYRKKKKDMQQYQIANRIVQDILGIEEKDNAQEHQNQEKQKQR